MTAMTVPARMPPSQQRETLVRLARLETLVEARMGPLRSATDPRTADVADRRRLELTLARLEAVVGSRDLR